MLIGVIIFFTLLLLFARQKKKWGVSLYLISVYLLSLLFAIFFLISYPDKNNVISIPGSIVFCIGIFLFISPFLIEKPKIKPPTLNQEKKLCYFVYTFCALLIICGLIVFPAIALAFATGASDIRSGYAMAFSSMFTGWKAYIYYFIATFYGMSYCFLILFFYALVFIKERTALKVMLFTSSLSAPYMGILDGGRTNLIYWLMIGGVSLVLFRPYMDKQIKRRLTIISSVVLSVAITYLVIVTNDRFSTADGGSWGSIFEYIGQPFVNFNDFFSNYHSNSYSLARIFPRLSSLIGGDFDLYEYRDDIMSSSGMSIGIFYTLLGDLYVDVGLFGMLLYALIYRIITLQCVSKTEWSISNIIIFSLLIQIPLHGLFFYSLWTIKASDCIILTLLLYCLFKKD